MNKLILIFLVTVSVAGTSLMAGKSWTGHISDSKCGVAHADHSAKSIGCVKSCVGGGAQAVFVTEDKKVIKISNPDKVTAHLGHQVEITGVLKDGALTIKDVKHLAP